MKPMPIALVSVTVDPYFLLLRWFYLKHLQPLNHIWPLLLLGGSEYDQHRSATTFISILILTSIWNGLVMTVEVEAKLVCHHFQ